MTRIASALRARLEGVKKNEQGFTLIELLVVVIIIGILAAIAIPVFIGVQNNARNASIQSDLGNAKTALVAWYTANPGGTPDVTAQNVAATLGSYGYQATPGNTITFDSVASATSFCIEGDNDSTTELFHVTANGGIVADACP